MLLIHQSLQITKRRLILLVHVTLVLEDAGSESKELSSLAGRNYVVTLPTEYQGHRPANPASAQAKLSVSNITRNFALGLMLNLLICLLYMHIGFLTAGQCRISLLLRWACTLFSLILLWTFHLMAMPYYNTMLDLCSNVVKR